MKIFSEYPAACRGVFTGDFNVNKERIKKESKRREKVKS